MAIMPVVSARSIEAVTIQGFDVLLRHHLPQIFVANPTRWIPRTRFFRSKNGKVNVCCFEYFSNGSCHFLVALVKRTHTANPVKNIGFGILCHKRYIQSSSPFSTVVIVDLPRIGVALNVVKQRSNLARKVALFHDKVTTHIYNFRYVLDGDRAYLHTSATGSTCP